MREKAKAFADLLKQYDLHAEYLHIFQRFLLKIYDSNNVELWSARATADNILDKAIYYLTHEYHEPKQGLSTTTQRQAMDGDEATRLATSPRTMRAVPC